MSRPKPFRYPLDLEYVAMARILSPRDFVRVTRSMRPLIALDVGGRKCGIALSDHFRSSVFPHSNVSMKGHQDDIAKLSRTLSAIASEYDAAGLVIGWPLERNGEAGKACRTVLNVAEEVGDTFSLPMTLWDERFSSKRARDFLERSRERAQSRQFGRRGAGSRRGKGRIEKREDVVAAAVILETFLAANVWEVDNLYNDDYEE